MTKQGGRAGNWASPIMLLFACDYAIFNAPITLNYARNYAPNYADYAKLMLIMQNYAVYSAGYPQRLLGRNG